MDELDRAAMFEDSGGIEATSGGKTAWGHLEEPTAEVFADPALVDADRAFVTDAAGDLGAGVLTIGATMTIGGTDYILRGPGVRIADGGLIAYPLAENT